MGASIDSGAGAGVVAVTPPPRHAASEVISAVRAGDAHTVEALLSAGADPDARDEHGTPALLDDASRPVRVSAVHGLARHDDERCVEGARRLPPAPPGTSYEYDLDEVWRYERRRDGR